MATALKTAAEKRRPPIVVVLGHVDHGKTTLLDFIRKANVAKREAGGITQSIGAYEITHAGKQLTFIDTPGHEAFSKMRSRGARIADIAILVIAADDGVKPQTKEAISAIGDAGIPFVVAINKIDARGADVDRVKDELTAAGVLLEGYGGKISYQTTSAKTGEGVPELLDLILLTADLEDLSFDPAHPAHGFILEAKLDKCRGVTAAAVVTDGKLVLGDEISAGEAYAKVKLLEDFRGARISSAVPSMPVLILGFDRLPVVGGVFERGEKPPVSAATVTRRRPEPRGAGAGRADRARVNFILKADVSGSLEALTGAIERIPMGETVQLDIVEQGVGDITDGDVKLAISTKAIIIGFRVSITKAADNLIRAQRVRAVTSAVIYDLTKEIQAIFETAGHTVVTAALEVLAVFGKQGEKQVIGGRVLEGVFDHKAKFEISRRGAVSGSGRVINIQCDRRDVSQVSAAIECGLLVDADIELRKGDRLVVHS